jgi:3-oxoacyl-[acyl-carrier-protein] synthase-1
MESKVAEKNMREVWVAADTIVSPLGNSTSENFIAVENGRTGLSEIVDTSIQPNPFYAGRISSLKGSTSVTRFEEMCLQAISSIKKQVSFPLEKTILILSTTKGNIAELGQAKTKEKRVQLHQVADFLSRQTGFRKHVVVSNACISGIMAFIVGKRFLASGSFDHALIVGADELSQFVLSGFASLHALSDGQCKPFDVARNGINLGEAAAAVLITTDPKLPGADSSIKILGTGLTNDANHISGPSRTGEELSSAIDHAVQESNLAPHEIDFVSGHGTATLYNDEMEAKALSLSNLSEVPTHSLKGYYGHTLGAAGVVESIIGLESLRKNTIVSTLGYSVSGVSKTIKVTRENIYKPLRTFLKTASGFGGCNAAIVFQKQ